MNDRLRAAFLRQSQGCGKLGSPFMERWALLMADKLQPGDPISDRVLNWPGDVSAMGHSVPLRLAGALHALVLSGEVPELAEVYPPAEFDPEKLWQRTHAAFLNHTARLQHWLDSPPQTNEVRRAAGLLAGANVLAGLTPLPMVVSELGASAGLNLAFDRYTLELGDRRYGAADSAVRLTPSHTGTPPEPRAVSIAARAGVDLRPIRLTQPVDRLRLTAYLWPDQPDRLRLTKAAMALAETEPEAGDAATWLEARLAESHPGHVHLITHTIAWQYFPEETQRACSEALARAGAAATPDAPLARLAMEADGVQETARLSLQFWDGAQHHGEEQVIARIDFHGRALHFL